MTLAKAWALGVYNDSGASTSPVIKGVPWRRNSDGTYTYGATVTLLDGSAGVSNGGQLEGAAQDNDADDWDGLDCWIEGTLGTGSSAVSVFFLAADASAQFPGDVRSGINIHAYVPSDTAPRTVFIV